MGKKGDTVIRRRFVSAALYLGAAVLLVNAQYPLPAAVIHDNGWTLDEYCKN